MLNEGEEYGANRIFNCYYCHIRNSRYNNLGIFYYWSKVCFIEIFQNILGYAKYLLVVLPFVFFAYLWKRTRERERKEELIEELERNNDFSPSGQKVN